MQEGHPLHSVPAVLQHSPDGGAHVRQELLPVAGKPWLPRLLMVAC